MLELKWPLFNKFPIQVIYAFLVEDWINKTLLGGSFSCIFSQWWIFDEGIYKIFYDNIANKFQKYSTFVQMVL